MRFARLACWSLPLAAAGLLAGCGSTAAPTSAPSAAAPGKSNAPAPPRCNPHRPIAVGSTTRSYAAVVKNRVIAYRAPRGKAFLRLGHRNVNGVPTVFAVEEQLDTARCKPAWYRVQIPVRPNGTSGWVRARAVQVLPLDTKIVIHVKAARLELYQRGHVVLRTRIAPGAPETPTPVGHFYITQRLVPADPTGAYGPAALGTSAFSPVLKDWAQGGPIGIHGTNEPWVIGHAVSHGCIRLPNATMKRLFHFALAGTPVEIRA